MEVGHSGTQGDESRMTERKKRRMSCDKYYKNMGERQRDTAGRLRKRAEMRQVMVEVDKTGEKDSERGKWRGYLKQGRSCSAA